MPKSRRVPRYGRPVLAGAPLIASLVALLLGGCGGQANTSAPVAADQPIIYTYTDADAQGVGLIAISGRDGSTRWRTALGFDIGTAIAAGDALYTCIYPAKGGFGEDIVALRLRDGKQLWRTSLVPSSQEPGACRFATDGATLALVGGQRTPTPGDAPTLYALNPADGSIRWHQAVNAVGPVLVRHGALYTIVNTDPYHNNSLSVAAFAARDGKPLWSVPYAGSAFVADDRALYTDEHGQAIAALALGDGHRVWDHAFAPGEGLGSVVAVTDQALVIGSRTQTGGMELSALAPTDGRQLWRSPTDLPFAVSWTNSVIVPPYLYTVSVSDRDVVAIRLSDGTPVWGAKLAQDELSAAEDVIALGGVVVVLLEPPQCFFICPGRVPRIVALDGATGVVAWRQDAPGAERLVARAPS
jgi:outer membrane protein assembly factor BamB